MITSYVFHLGRKPLLSIAELSQIFGNNIHIDEITNEEAIVTLEKPLDDARQFLNTLGGIIKIGHIFHTLETSEELHLEHTLEHITEHTLNKFKDIKTKINFGISHYNVPPKHKKFLTKLLKGLKDNLKASGYSSRFVNKNFQNVHNVVISEEKLIDKGIEITITHGKEQVYIAETVAIQDFKSYSHRDYGKPSRDQKKGMLPPKVAQMMLNLSGIRQNQQKEFTIYDPFCGNGTVLLEALLMGYSVVGSDIDPASIEATKKNIEWLQNEYPETKNLASHIFQKDITKLAGENIPQGIDAIITESYLGPPLKKNIDPNSLPLISRELEHLHTSLFQNIKKVFEKTLPIVIAIPAFRTKNQFLYLNYFPELLKKFQFTAIPPIPHHIQNRFNLQVSNRNSLLYERPDQHTAREIFIINSI